FGLHTFGGNLGWAAAPPAMLFLADQFGWRVALIVAGVAGYVVLFLLWRDRDELRHESRRKSRPDEKLTPAAVLAVFSSWPVVMCFTYFLLMSFSLIGVQNFLPPILAKLNGTPLAVGSTALTGFLLGSAAGVLAGGWLADRMTRHEIIVAGGILTAAPLVLWLGHADFAAAVLIAVTTIAGLAIGITTPSRDMLVRSASPRGATGRVFGFVYSGLDAGSAIAPPIIGYLIDGGRPGLVFWLMSVSLLLAVFTAIGLRQAAQARA
ncbi:MAG: MFS transporter, partial [Ferrovibrionaceae bacterium]